MRAMALPILVPFSTAALLMLAPKRPLVQRWIALAGSVLLLVSAIALFRRVDAATLTPRPAAAPELAEGATA